MTFAERFENTFRRILPAPFTIAILLTFLTFGLALIFTPSSGNQNHALELLGYWEKGLWDAPLLVFAFQMMLILVLGHALALSPLVSRLIHTLTLSAHTPAKAAWLVTFATMLVAFFNWGLGLIFGAILARKIGEAFAQRGEKLNYALIGATGYSGFMVWHGGISGSAPAKVVEPEHLKTMMQGIYTPEQMAALPSSLPFNMTIFSNMNLFVSALLLLIVPLFAAWLAKKAPTKAVELRTKASSIKLDLSTKVGAERLDNSKVFCYLLGGILFLYSLHIPLSQNEFSFNFFTINYINLLLLSMALLAHGRFSGFLKAIDEAIGGAAGILIQFPLYFGILGIMKHSGLIDLISHFFTSISNQTTFPILTFFSAGLVNFFVPSGGGQWSIQGPIIIQAAQELDLSLSKGIMAMAYGDQLTNMLQPFWALPLLGITGLKARDIIPYTLLIMVVGMLLFLTGLILF